MRWRGELKLMVSCVGFRAVTSMRNVYKVTMFFSGFVCAYRFIKGLIVSISLY